jgi:tetratricopeptide (TPR) repeat protein
MTEPTALKMRLMKYAASLLLGLVLASVSYAQASRGVQPVQKLCREARRQLEEGNYAQALKTAKNALRLNVRSAEAQSLLGQAEFALGKLPAAEEHLREALKIDPILPEAHRALGATFLKQRRFEAAQGQFEAVLRSQPDDIPCLYGLGFSLLSQDKPSQALGPLLKASHLNPTDPKLLTGILKARLKLEQPSQAAAVLAELNRQFAHDYAQQMQLAVFLVQERAYDLAIVQFKQLLKVNPGSYELNYNLALAYHRAGKEDQAATQIHKMLAQEDAAELWNLLGAVEEKRNNYPQALDAYRQAAKLQPKNEDYQLDYATELALHGDPSEALKIFATDVKSFPDSVTLWIGLGGCYFLLGKYREASETLLHAEQIAPGNPNVYVMLGLAYDSAGTLQKVIGQRFHDYVKTHPSDALAHYFYGKILLNQSKGQTGSNLDQAQQELNKAILLNPSLAQPRLELAKLLRMSGHFRAARTQLETAVKLDPASREAYYELMQVYRNLGQAQEAAIALEKFRQLKNPENKESKRKQVMRLLVGAKQ